MQFIGSLTSIWKNRGDYTRAEISTTPSSFPTASPVRTYLPEKVCGWTNEAKVPDTDEQFAIHSQCIHTARTEFSMGPEMWAYRYRSFKSVTLTLFSVHLSITETTGSTPTPSQRLILFMSIEIFFKTSTGSFPRTELVRKNHTGPH